MTDQAEQTHVRYASNSGFHEQIYDLTTGRIVRSDTKVFLLESDKAYIHVLRTNRKKQITFEFPRYAAFLSQSGKFVPLTGWFLLSETADVGPDRFTDLEFEANEVIPQPNISRIIYHALGNVHHPKYQEQVAKMLDLLGCQPETEDQPATNE